MRYALALALLLGCKQERQVQPAPAPVDVGPPLVLAVEPAPVVPVDALVAVDAHVAVDAGPKVVDAAVAELAADDVRAFVEARTPYLVEACGARAAAAKIAEVTVTLTVGADGRPTRYLWKTFGPTEVCLQNEIGQWRLPRSPKGGVSEAHIRF